MHTTGQLEDKLKMLRGKLLHDVIKLTSAGKASGDHAEQNIG